MSFANHEKIYVATYKEIILAIVTFSVILIALYPKDVIEKQILNEKSNYDLSMLYLKNMLKNDPGNEALMLTLAKQSLTTGNKDLSIELLGLLKNSENKEIKDETYILSYRLLKDDYFYLEGIGDIDKLQVTYKKLEALMKVIVLTPLNDEVELVRLYQEASFLKDTKSSYIFLEQLLANHPDNLTYNKQAYYLTNRLGKQEEAMYHINKLIILDPDNSDKWIEAKYYLHLEHSSYEDAETFLKNKANDSVFWRNKLVSFYEYNKQYKHVSNMNMDLFDQSTSKKKQRYHWLKAVNALMYGNYINEAVALGYKYEEYFIQDKKARIELLKLYISSNRLKRASALSKKILKRNLY